MPGFEEKDSLLLCLSGTLAPGTPRPCDLPLLLGVSLDGGGV